MELEEELRPLAAFLTALLKKEKFHSRVFVKRVLFSTFLPGKDISSHAADELKLHPTKPPPQALLYIFINYQSWCSSSQPNPPLQCSHSLTLKHENLNASCFAIFTNQ